MFGHRDDVIKQDQKRDADVKLPDAAFEMLTTPPAKSSQTDSPNPSPSSSPPPQKTAGLAATSVDGFSAPSANLTDPLNYSVTPAPSSPFVPTQQSDDHYQDEVNTDENTRHNPVVLADHPPLDMEPIELSHSDNPRDDYLDNLSHDTPLNQLDELAQEDTNTSLPQEIALPEPEENIINLDQQSQSSNSDSIVQDDKISNTTSDSVISNDLSELKQAALAELSPLVDKLSLEPDERFRTLMMLIQASDNQALLPQAHAAATQISDEKTRAQALLDIVNEINYFSK